MSTGKNDCSRLQFNAGEGLAEACRRPGLPGGNRLDLRHISSHRQAMGLPTQPVQLSVEQIDDLNRKLSSMRHDVNNQLSLILAAIELIRYKPDMLQRMTENLIQQPPKITETMSKFSLEFEKVFGITR
jgi:hypothetical protein